MDLGEASCIGVMSKGEGQKLNLGERWKFGAGSPSSRSEGRSISEKRSAADTRPAEPCLEMFHFFFQVFPKVFFGV